MSKPLAYVVGAAVVPRGASDGIPTGARTPAIWLTICLALLTGTAAIRVAARLE